MLNEVSLLILENQANYFKALLRFSMPVRSFSKNLITFAQIQ